MDNEECNMQGSFEGSGYFLKVMPADFAQKLTIPAGFVPNLRFETSENVILRGPSAQRWVVKLWGTSTQLEFRQGWENFVHHHAIELGDHLLFKYICNSYFKVKIFGRNGLEKNMTRSESLRKRCRDTATATPLPVALDSDQDINDDPTQAVAQNGKNIKLSSEGNHPQGSRHCKPSLLGKKQATVKFAETAQKSCEKIKPRYSFCMRRLTEAERMKALKDAYSFTSNNPFCLVVMKPSHVCGGFCLSFAKRHEGRLKLPKQTSEVILVDPDTIEWPVRYIWSSSGGRGSLCGGWRHFTLNNNLEAGDICVFERVDQSKNRIKVHIFKVANKCTYKMMTGETMDDTPALPATDSNKKLEVSREDLDTDLLAKEHRPVGL